MSAADERQGVESGAAPICLLHPLVDRLTTCPRCVTQPTGLDR